MNNAAWFSVNLARQVYGIMRRVAQKKASIQNCMLRLAMSKSWFMTLWFEQFFTSYCAQHSRMRVSYGYGFYL